MYTIRYSNKSKGTIQIEKSALITDEVDIALIGKKRREYGLVFNENVLHLLENFACPENPSAVGTPDFTSSLGLLLENPIEGQLWYNSTTKTINVWDSNKWVKLRSISDIASNSGVISHGVQIPLPIAPDGSTFTYEECSMTVSPYHYPSEIDFLECSVDDNGLVTSQYRTSGDQTLTSGLANFFIVGIRGDDKDSDPSSSNPPVSVPAPSNPASPTPTITPTPSSTPVAGVTPTPTPSVTPSPTISVTPTPSAVTPLQATMYIAPSDGDLGTPFTATGDDNLMPCNVTNGDISDCLKFMYVSIKEITGGDGGPYTVEWNLTFETSVVQIYQPAPEGPKDPESPEITPSEPLTHQVGTAPIIDDATDFNVLQTTGIAVATCQIQANNWGQPQFPTTGTATDQGVWFIRIKSGSYARILDGSGNDLVIYTPSGFEGDVLGTSNNSPTGDYFDGYTST